MGIIGSDDQEFRLRGEGGIRPRGSRGVRPPTMVGRPRAGDWQEHTFIPEGKPVESFGLPGRMDTNQVWARLRRGNHSNPSPHNIPPRGGPLAIFF